MTPDVAGLRTIAQQRDRWKRRALDAEARADRAEAIVARVQAFKDSLPIGEPIPWLPELRRALEGEGGDQ